MTAVRRITVTDLQAMRERGERITMLTAYDYSTAKIADEAGIPVLLVGDSLGMVVLGYESTLPVTVDDMVRHGAAVVRGAQRAHVVVDMPFGSYEESPSQAFHNAAKVIKETQCGAVKIEGGRRMAETIHFLSQRGIPVMAHIGLTPQMIHVKGGFRTVGRAVDYRTDPITYVRSMRLRNGLWGLRALSQRADLLDTSKILETAALDQYEFVRDAYLQRRRNLV